MRKRIIAGNWKMNKTPKEAAEFARELAEGLKTSLNDVVLCVPFVDLYPVLKAIEGTAVSVGAQNMHFQDSGAFTGEISAGMLASMGVKYVIIGHSERREYFAETDETVNKKVLKALEKGLLPIVCVGERLNQREQGITADLIRMQTRIAFDSVKKADAASITVAYEPIWAIGTGRTASKEQAEEACAVIRSVIADIFDASTADAIRVQYGGSVTESNAYEIFSMPDIDGGLVGGASLKAEFVRIANSL